MLVGVCVTENSYWPDLGGSGRLDAFANNNFGFGIDQTDSALDAAAPRDTKATTAAEATTTLSTLRRGTTQQALGLGTASARASR